MSSFDRDRVLVIGDEMRIFLAVTRALGRAGREVHAVPFVWDSPALSSRYVTSRYSVPLYQDDPEGWLSSLAKILRDNRIGLVIPTCDRAILPLHEHREELAEFRLAIPPSEAMSALFDKQQTRQLCARLGVPVADGAPLAIGDDAHGLAQRYGLPLIVKPRRSYWLDRMETWGRVHVLDDERTLGQVLSEISDHSRYLVEGHFKGCGVGVSVLARDGEIHQAFQHRRLREGRGGSSSYRVSETLNEELLDACARISRELRLTGVCMFEFRHDRETGRWILIETNARFWGSMSLPLSLGIDFPNLLHDLLVNGKVHAPRSYPAGVRSRNLVLDGRNLLSLIRGRAPAVEKLREVRDFLAQPLYWAMGRERSDSFVLDDLGPALRECRALLGSISAARAARLGKKQVSLKFSAEAQGDNPAIIPDRLKKS
jgi:predicted ATP-grasp superfamily ATP-dependent carboligase